MKWLRRFFNWLKRIFGMSDFEKFLASLDKVLKENGSSPISPEEKIELEISFKDWMSFLDFSEELAEIRFNKFFYDVLEKYSSITKEEVKKLKRQGMTVDKIVEILNKRDKDKKEESEKKKTENKIQSIRTKSLSNPDSASTPKNDS
ncbi:hypothetical protein LMG16407_04766 [Pandoraea apista]|nr:hypothetical protein LMG16407_04766 [Pandoraea apista]